MENFGLQPFEELRLQLTSGYQQTVLANRVAAIGMHAAAVAMVGAFPPTAGDDGETAAARPASHEAAEEIRGTGGAASAHAPVTSVEALDEFEAFRHLVPHHVGDDALLGDFRPSPFTFRRAPVNTLARLGRTNFFRSAPQNDTAVALISQDMANG